MAANTVLLDFSIEPTRISDELSRKDMVKVIKENLEKYFGNLKFIYDMLVDDGYLCILNDNTATIFTIRFFNEGLITINIEYWKKEDDSQRISFEVCEIFPFLLFLTFCFTYQLVQKSLARVLNFKNIQKMCHKICLTNEFLTLCDAT
jgi:spermine synthase